mmetsp:Transcript_20300/g.28474  ORF Transcript_20300/g.28474 Transcript_20300/m.28474 type:complete len:333 (-) Transcript_20300:42-1040(-)
MTEPALARSGNKARSGSIHDQSGPPAMLRANSTTNFPLPTGIPDKQGFLSKRNKGIIRNTWKDKFFVLCGETLYYYKTREDQVPRGAFHLKGSITVDLAEAKAKRKHCFCIQTVKEDIFLSAKDEKEKEEWVRKVNNAATKDAQSPPDRGNAAAQGRKFLMQSKFVDTLTRFGPGKRLVMDFITDDTILLIDSVKSFVKKVDGEEQAERLEKTLISVGFKAAFLYSEKKIAKEYFEALREPLHKMCDKLIDGYELPFLYNSADVVASIDAFRKAVEKTFGPYFTEKTMTKMAFLFNYFMNETLLDDFFTKKKWTECGEMATTLRRLWEAGQV